jgi:methionyl-tRNA formyltransferase
MKQMSEPIVFFGSGPVAAKSLELLTQDFTIEAVITKPRPAHHKGAVPVLATAEKLSLPIHTSTNKRELDTLFTSANFKSRVAVLIDFGIIVSQDVIDYFPLGIVNSHFSLLPEWRGADPITFSILSGQAQTGVSLMLLVQAMDEGPILSQAVYDIKADETTPSLTEQLIKLSADLLRDILPKYVSGETVPKAQEDAAKILQSPPKISYSRKLTKEDSIIDWNKPAGQLEREIRAFNEWPKNRTTISSLELVVTKAHVIKASGKPGERTIEAKQPVIYCGKNALAIDRLKPAGKQEMTGEAFLAGYKHLFL